jgi:hypothetical protein
MNILRLQIDSPVIQNQLPELLEGEPLEEFEVFLWHFFLAFFEPAVLCRVDFKRPLRRAREL